MGRQYEVKFENITVAAVQDLFSIQSTANMAFKLLEVVLGQISVTTVENLRLSIKRFSGAYTIGSAGASATPQKHNFGDAAATCTARTNDTTQTTGGTSVTIRGDIYNQVNGYQYLAIPDKEIIIPPSQALVISLDSAPAGNRVTNGSLLFEELF